MHMTIIMTMNIYIRPSLEKKLREEDSMSGLINELLANHYDGKDLEPVIKHITNQPAAPDEDGRLQAIEEF